MEINIVDPNTWDGFYALSRLEIYLTQLNICVVSHILYIYILSFIVFPHKTAIFFFNCLLTFQKKNLLSSQCLHLITLFG